MIGIKKFSDLPLATTVEDTDLVAATQDVPPFTSKRYPQSLLRPYYLDPITPTDIVYIRTLAELPLPDGGGNYNLTASNITYLFLNSLNLLDGTIVNSGENVVIAGLVEKNIALTNTNPARAVFHNVTNTPNLLFMRNIQVGNATNLVALELTDLTHFVCTDCFFSATVASIQGDWDNWLSTDCTFRPGIEVVNPTNIIKWELWTTVIRYLVGSSEFLDFTGLTVDSVAFHGVSVDGALSPTSAFLSGVPTFVIEGSITVDGAAFLNTAATPQLAGGLSSKTPGVWISSTYGAEGIPNSHVRGGLIVVDNTTETVLLQNVSAPILVDPLTVSGTANLERMAFSTAASRVFLNSESSFTREDNLMVSLTINRTTGSGSPMIKVFVHKNGGAIAGFIWTFEVEANIKSTSFVLPVSHISGDSFEVHVTNVTNDNNVTVVSLNLLIL